MAMCLSLLHYKDVLTLIATFENGYASVHRLDPDADWVTTYRSQAHSQPILSLDIDPERRFFLTSSADSLIAKHPIPTDRHEIISVPESSARVVEIEEEEDSPKPQSLLSAALKSSSTPRGPAPSTVLQEWKDPLKVINTKHHGQQSLRIRSDGRIFATAGWDSKVRVYSVKTMKELAVLKWHQVGCYAVAFSDLTAPSTLSDSGSRPTQTQDTTPPNPSQASERSEAPHPEIIPKDTRTLVKTTTSVKDRRIAQAKSAHWLAAGAKDGKVSLWDIY
jgi:WD40 repeat protein